MTTADDFGGVAPCSKWQGEGKDELPGYRYSPGADSPHDMWDYPCVTYDANNETSQKEAMKAAKKMGIEQMNKLNKELEQEMAKEKFKAAVQRED